MNLDRDEQRIHSVFSQMHVNTKNLERKVKNRMQNNNSKAMPPRRKLGFVMALAAIIVLAAGTVYAASQGAFDRFIANQNPPFAEIIDPVEIYVTDQGIRMEVIGAQRFGDEAIIYVSLQDISGQNRLTEQTLIWPSRSAHSIPSSWGQQLIYFDQETNTAYMELNFELASRMILMAGSDYLPEHDICPSDALELLVGEIVFDQGSIETAFPVPLSQIAEAHTMEYPTRSSDSNRILVPSRGEDFPALPDFAPQLGMSTDGHRRWISSLAIMDGYLHVQLGSTSWAGSTGSVRLTDPDGEFVFPYGGQEWFQADENLQPVLPEFGGHTIVLMDEYGYQPEQFSYSFSELVFPINVDYLAYYSLTFTDFFQTGVQGEWEVRIYIDSASDQILSWEGNVTVGEFTLESMIINPLGIRLQGGFEYDGRWINIGNEVLVETPEGTFTLGHTTGWYTSTAPPERNAYTGTYEHIEAWSFDIRSTAYSPIDVTSIIAVIIDGVRIPLN